MNDHEKKAQKGRFLVAACAFILNDEGELLLTKRSPKRDHDAGEWELVSGRFNQNFKTVEEEVTREIKEELGNDLTVELVAPFSFYHFYRGGDKNDELVGINYLCRYITGEVALSEEHTEYCWMQPKEAIKIVGHELLRKDIEHFLKIGFIYLDNAKLLKEAFKRSN